jgi:hypothetical protein
MASMPTQKLFGDTITSAIIRAQGPMPHPPPGVPPARPAILIAQRPWKSPGPSRRHFQSATRPAALRFRHHSCAERPAELRTGVEGWRGEVAHCHVVDHAPAQRGQSEPLQSFL